MSESTELVKIVKIESVASPHPVRVRIPRKAQIAVEDAISRPEVEVVSGEELRHHEQVKSKAPAPETFFNKAPEGVPGFPGADVSSVVFHDFLAAAEFMVPDSDACPILSSVKVTYKGGERIYVEAMGGGLWAVVAIEATPSGGDGFVAMMPLRRARSAVNSVRLNYKVLRVGLSEDKLCMGPVMIPYGGRVADFPAHLTYAWETRAVAPAFYFKEVYERVVPAQSADPTETNLHGVLLDYDVCEIDGQMRVLCTAVATDGKRMHMMRLPQMQIDPMNSGAMPPAVVVSEKFFGYLGAVAKGDAGLELGEEQVVVRGKDYMAAAEATMRGNSARPVQSWRDVDVDYQGYWTADPKDLEYIARTALEASDDGEVRLRIDSLTEQLELCSWGNEGSKFKDTIPVRRFGGPPAVHVIINGRYLAEAVFACRSELIRLGFSEDLENQRSAPMTIRGEDELFKAIIMPIRG